MKLIKSLTRAMETGRKIRRITGNTFISEKDVVIEEKKLWCNELKGFNEDKTPIFELKEISEEDLNAEDWIIVDDYKLVEKRTIRKIRRLEKRVKEIKETLNSLESDYKKNQDDSIKFFIDETNICLMTEEAKLSIAIENLKKEIKKRK